jgi:FAD binding domain
MNMSVMTKALRDIAGLDISSAPEQCVPYARDASGYCGATPLAVVRPHTMPALIALVRRAAELGLRLQPISSTGQHQRGDTLCQPGSLVVDMSAFDQVVRVDRRNRVVLFEAGVTFPKLCEALATRQMRAMLPLCPRPGKSALTAYLEREPTIYPRFQWDLSDPLLCIEAVFGSGELFRTGGAAGPGTLAEQWASGDAQKTPMGPGHSDIARIVQGAQGNLAIVSWCSAKAEPIPLQETLYRLDAPDLTRLIDLCYRLLHRSLPDICFIVDSAALAALQGEPVTAALLAMSQWHLVFSLSAPQLLGMEKLAWMQDEVQRYCSEAGLAGQLHGFAPRHQKLHQRLLTAGVGTPWWKQANQQACFELFFQSTMDRCARFVPGHARTLAAHGWSTPTLCYIQPQLGGRNCHMEFIFPHAGTVDSHAAVATLAASAASELKAQGAFFSRPYGPLIELTANDSAAMRERLSRVFDPAGVMAASVWPIVPHQPTQARAA